VKPELRYCVTGTDTFGDRHTFETGSSSRAEAVLASWRHDLKDVTSRLDARAEPGSNDARCGKCGADLQRFPATVRKLGGADNLKAVFMPGKKWS
jgi:hypothetical protein